MQARREEEAIIADGPQEQGLCGPWGFGAGPGRNQADEGTQLAEIQGFARVVSRPERAVFAGEGSKIGLLRHQVKVYRRSLQVVSKQPLKGPCSVQWVCSWQSFDLLQICLSEGRPIFVCQVLIKPGLMMQF